MWFLQQQSDIVGIIRSKSLFFYLLSIRLCRKHSFEPVKAFQECNPIQILNESRYVKLVNTMYRVLRNSRIPLFLHRKSNHVFSVWQHIVLLTVRQYEDKSYRMFAEWLVEAYYLRLSLQLSRIPHYTTLQKFAARISGTLLERIISSFIILLLSNIKRLVIGIDSSGFKLSNASQYYIPTK